MHKRLFFIFFYCFLSPLSAQNWGWSSYLDLNIYQNYQQAQLLGQEGASAGQWLNLLPAVGLGVYRRGHHGQSYQLLLATEYQPFAMNSQDYGGLGSLSFPLLFRAQHRFSKKEIGMGGFMSLGAGIQWSRIHLYDRPESLRQLPNPYFYSWVVELAFGLEQLVQFEATQKRRFAFFFRFGSSELGAETLNFGLRLGFDKPFSAPFRQF
ncbi:hypothetical protein [Saprospira grandis]|uniref:hypothetical protein n=1 Tax=Saprospira grandis TaxID=1008 RepID=UPI0022DD7B3E|nr:hypothetical protein [Saprospira grandis]WBM75177.1 hypothetical protein OP864_02820 [Saprospira grandis]